MKIKMLWLNIRLIHPIYYKAVSEYISAFKMDVESRAGIDRAVTKNKRSRRMNGMSNMNMNRWNQSGYLNSLVAGYQDNKKTTDKKNDTVKNSWENDTTTEKDKKLNNVGGRTIGEPKLSDKALKYYEQLKKKFSNMDFILVSPDKKEEVERNKGMYASSKELLVLIDSDKIERMAEDEAYRKKYEGILAGATAQVAQMKLSLGTNASRVSSFGMTFDDHGNASFFAVVDKSLALQQDRIAAKREENVKTKKEEAKKAEKKRAEEKRAERKKTEADTGDKVTVRADSWDELLKKIDDVIMFDMADHMLTDSERQVGQNFDFSL